MKKYVVEIKTEYFDLDKEDVYEDVARTDYLSVAVEKAGKVVKEMLRDGMVIDEAHTYSLSLETKGYPKGDGITKYIRIFDKATATPMPIAYGYLCREIGKEDALRIIELISNEILTVSGHGKS